MNITTEPLAYFVGDVPSPLTLDIDQDLTGVSEVAAALISPDLTATILTSSIEGDTVVVEFPETSLFDTRGVYTIVVSLDGNTVSPWRFPVEDTRGWLTLNETRLFWLDAPASDLELFELLDSAHTAVVEFAPAVAADEAIPSNYRKGQLLQAQAVHNSSRATNADQLGAGDYAVTVFPLDWNVKQLLRPKDPAGGMW